jgi:DNA-binding transcriptional regulator LsrR (DeoR family)
MFYEQSLSKSEIARRTRLSVTHVNRLLREGMRTGVVEVRVKGRTVHSLESDLIKAFGIRDARVVASSASEESTRVDLGRAAAALFDELVTDGASVGIGSGRTLFEMASRLPEKPRAISLYPANLIVEQDLHLTGVSASAAVTIAWFRSRPVAEAQHLEMFFPSTNRRALVEYADQVWQTSTLERFRKEILSLDTYFLGASGVRKDSRLAQLANQSSNGQEFHQIVGDVAFNLLDAAGKEVDLDFGRMVLKIPADRLNRIAQTDKAVVLVAGGKKKLRVISAALSAQLCNLLVTDSDVAEELLNQKAARFAIPSSIKEEENGKRRSREETDISISNGRKGKN